MVADVALGPSVAQIVVRAGMPPGTPAWVQSIARLGSRTPAHEPEGPASVAASGVAPSFVAVSEPASVDVVDESVPASLRCRSGSPSSLAESAASEHPWSHAAARPHAAHTSSPSLFRAAMVDLL